MKCVLWEGFEKSQEGWHDCHHVAEWWPPQQSRTWGCISYSFLAPTSSAPGPHQPLKPQLCISGVLGLFISTSGFPLCVTHRTEPKKPICLSWSVPCFLWIPRTKHGGEGLEHLPQPYRALFCSHHEDGMKVLWRIRSLRNVLHLLHGRETIPQNWIPKRGLENPQPEGLQWGWELVTGLRSCPWWSSQIWMVNQIRKLWTHRNAQDRNLFLLKIYYIIF